MIVHQYYHRDPRVRRYAEALADTGVRVDVLCLRDPKERTPPRDDRIRIFPIPLSRLSGGRGSYLRETVTAFILFTAWLLPLYIRNRYQVIHVHNMPDFLAFAALIPRMVGARLILDIHDPMPEVFMSKYGYRSDGVALGLVRLEEKFSSLLAHRVITANAHFKRNLVGRGIPADKIAVVNNLPDPRIFSRLPGTSERSADAESLRLIYPGTIAPRYGFDVAIRALPVLLSRIPKVQLLIIGPPTEHVDELRSLARQLGVLSLVEFKPTIPVNEVPRQISRADVGIYTAVRDPHMSVATPTKVLEYAFMGIPIVAARLPVLEDMFSERSVMFFEPGNVDQFAQRVLELFDSPARRAELVRNADMDFVRSHSWNDEKGRYFHVLNQLLPNRAKVPSGEMMENASGKSA